jgi:COMPASS component SWD1
VEEQLSAAPARCLAFNPWGTLLAVGCLGGAVAIYDYQTRGLASVLQRDPDHKQMKVQGTMEHPQGACDITALLWSADGATLLSGASDGSLVWWEVVRGKPRLRWHCGCDYGTTSGGITHLAWACSRQQQLRGGSCDDVLVSMSAGPALLLNQYSEDPHELPVIAIGGWVPV